MRDSYQAKRARAKKRLERALKRWDREWGEVARNDPYAAPWDHELGLAIAQHKRAFATQRGES